VDISEESSIKFNNKRHAAKVADFNLAFLNMKILEAAYLQVHQERDKKSLDPVASLETMAAFKVLQECLRADINEHKKRYAEQDNIHGNEG
jgi:hypothetical protein